MIHKKQHVSSFFGGHVRLCALLLALSLLAASLAGCGSRTVGGGQADSADSGSFDAGQPEDPDSIKVTDEESLARWVDAWLTDPEGHWVSGKIDCKGEIYAQLELDSGAVRLDGRFTSMSEFSAEGEAVSDDFFKFTVTDKEGSVTKTQDASYEVVFRDGVTGSYYSGNMGEDWVALKEDSFEALWPKPGRFAQIVNSTDSAFSKDEETGRYQLSLMLEGDALFELLGQVCPVVIRDEVADRQQITAMVELGVMGNMFMPLSINFYIESDTLAEALLAGADGVYEVSDGMLFLEGTLKLRDDEEADLYGIMDAAEAGPDDPQTLVRCAGEAIGKFTGSSEGSPSAFPSPSGLDMFGFGDPPAEKFAAVSDMLADEASYAVFEELAVMLADDYPYTVTAREPDTVVVTVTVTDADASWTAEMRKEAGRSLAEGLSDNVALFSMYAITVGSYVETDTPKLGIVINAADGGELFSHDFTGYVE